MLTTPPPLPSDTSLGNDVIPSEPFGTKFGQASFFLNSRHTDRQTHRGSCTFWMIYSIYYSHWKILASITLFQIKAVWSAMCDRHMGATEAQVLCRSKGFASGSQLGADVSDYPLMNKNTVESLFYGHLPYSTVDTQFYRHRSSKSNDF